MCKKYSFVVALFFIPLLSPAQSVIDLEEVIRIGLVCNYDLQISRNEQRISDNNLTLGNAGYLPTVDLNSGYNIRQTNADQFADRGGEAIQSRNSVTNTLDGSVNLNWTIFEGFRVKTNYQRLQEMKSVGELNTRMALENFIADISSEYFNYVQQTLRMHNLQHAVDLSRERLRIVEARYQIGSLSRLDLQQARVDFNADSSQLIQQYEVLHSSRIKLNEMMGTHDVERQIAAADTTIRFNPFLSRNELYDSMMRVNTSLLLTEKYKTISSLDLKTLQSRNYPYLRLNGGYGFTHYDYNKGTLEKQRNWGPTVGVTIGFNLFDGLNRKREQKNARVTIENQELLVERQRLSLQSEFANMWLAYQNNIELTKLEKESLENAQVNYDIAMDRYKLGDLSGILLREAQVGYLEAEQRLLTAQYRTKLYEISLLQISGRVVDYLE